MQNYYQILNVSQDSSLDTIDEAYINNLERFKILNDKINIQKLKEAYLILSDSYKREIYDKNLKESIFSCAQQLLDNTPKKISQDSNYTQNLDQIRTNTKNNVKYAPNTNFSPSKRISEIKYTPSYQTISSSIPDGFQTHEGFLKKIDLFNQDNLLEKEFIDPFVHKKSFDMKKNSLFAEQKQIIDRLNENFTKEINEAFNFQQSQINDRFNQRLNSQTQNIYDTNFSGIGQIPQGNSCHYNKSSKTEKYVNGVLESANQIDEKSIQGKDGQINTNTIILERTPSGQALLTEKLEDEFGVKSKQYQISDMEFRKLYQTPEINSCKQSCYF